MPERASNVLLVSSNRCPNIIWCLPPVSGVPNLFSSPTNYRIGGMQEKEILESVKNVEFPIITIWKRPHLHNVWATAEIMSGLSVPWNHVSLYHETMSLCRYETMSLCTMKPCLSVPWNHVSLYHETMSLCTMKPWLRGHTRELLNYLVSRVSILPLYQEWNHGSTSCGVKRLNMSI